MGWRQDALKTVGAGGEKRLGLFGNVRGMIVEYDSDGAVRRIPDVQIRRQADEFHAAVTILHACGDVAVLEIQSAVLWAGDKCLLAPPSAPLPRPSPPISQRSGASSRGGGRCWRCSHRRDSPAGLP